MIQKEKIMFFTLMNGTIININAIVKLPKVQEGAAGMILFVKMVDGSYEHIDVSDIRSIRERVVS